MKKENQRTRKISLTNAAGTIHKGWAKGMNSICSRLSIKTQKWLFFLVFVGVAIYCFSLLFGNGSGGLPDMAKIKNVRLQDVSVENPDYRGPHDKIRKLKQHMDSLPAKELDSFLLRHPGIIDSIRKWEQLLKIK